MKKFRVGDKQLNLRVFNLPHYRENKFPALPIVLFIHGMGGSLSQFYHLMDHMSHYAELVAVDLPGHGKSEFQPSDWASYKTERLLDVLETVLSSTCSEDREVVIIGHSMGCVLAAKLANRLGIRCIGMVAITPVAELDEKHKSCNDYYHTCPDLFSTSYGLWIDGEELSPSPSAEWWPKRRPRRCV